MSNGKDDTKIAVVFKSSAGEYAYAYKLDFSNLETDSTKKFNVIASTGLNPGLEWMTSVEFFTMGKEGYLTAIYQDFIISEISPGKGNCAEFSFSAG